MDVDIDTYRKKYSVLQEKLNEYKDGWNLDNDSFLENVIKMSQEVYIKCIRASLSPKIFLKRSPSEEFAHFDPDTIQHRDYDIGPAIGMSSKV